MNEQPRRFLDALMGSYVYHLRSGRCLDEGSVKAELRRLKQLQADYLAARAKQ